MCKIHSFEMVGAYSWEKGTFILNIKYPLGDRLTEENVRQAGESDSLVSVRISYKHGVTLDKPLVSESLKVPIRTCGC